MAQEIIYKMTAKRTLLSAGIIALLSVAIGAFGAHGLSEILEANNRLDTFETAVLYQMFHALALIALGILMLKMDHPFFKYSGLAFVIGIFIFSGSLYALSLTNITVLGAITPLGGLSFIIGWVFFLLGIKKTL